MVSTFLATLFLPVAAAVGIGVALSLLLQLNREAMDLAVVELVPLPDGRFAEEPAPKTARPAASPFSTSTAACSTPAPGPCRRGCPTRPGPTDPSWSCGCAAAPAWVPPSSS